jgi:hypothetical protein
MNFAFLAQRRSAPSGTFPEHDAPTHSLVLFDSIGDFPLTAFRPFSEKSTLKG